MKYLNLLTLASAIMMAPAVHSQCISTVSFGTLTANGSIYTPQQITSCNFAGDFATVTLPAGIWSFSTSISTDFITITNTSNTVLAYGTGSIQYTSLTGIVVRMHISANSSCSTASSCRASYVTQQEIPVPSISAGDTFLCEGEGPTTLTASNTFGSQTYWYDGSCASTPIDSGAVISVGPSSTTTYFAANYFNGNLGSCGTFTLSITPNPTLSFTMIQDVLCHGDSTGSLTAQASGGTGSMLYLWSNGQSGNTIIGLDSGLYIVSVTDSLGCAASDSQLVDQPQALSADVSILSNPLCHGDATGSASVTVMGGTTPYSYQWSNNDPTPQAVNLQAGTHYVLIIDSNGCTLTDSVTLIDADPILIAPFNKVNVACHGDSTGMMSVFVIGGTGTLSMLWSTGSTGSGITNLPAGMYTLTVTDQNGCAMQYTDEVLQPEALAFNFSISNASCNDATNGMISSNCSGGTQPYAFSWSNGGTSSDLQSLDTGIYVVTVTDSNNCQLVDSAEVAYDHEDPQVLSDSASKLCSGFEITLDAAANEPVTFLWQNGDTGQYLLVDSGGFYQVTVSNAFGCSSSHEFEVVEELCLAIEERLNNQKFSPYPNPAHAVVHVRALNAFQGNYTILLYGADGRLAASADIESAGNNTVSNFDLSGLPRGVYLMQISIEGSHEWHRIILQ